SGARDFLNARSLIAAPLKLRQRARRFREWENPDRRLIPLTVAPYQRRRKALVFKAVAQRPRVFKFPEFTYDNGVPTPRRLAHLLRALGGDDPFITDT